MSITEILQQVHDLTMTVEEALPLIQQHVDAANHRARFAAAALEGQLATGIRMASDSTLAQRCWALADCMVECAPEPQA